MPSEDLNLIQKISKWNKKNKVSVRFELDHPQIIYPDTTIAVKLDRLLWDSRLRKFEMAGLGFHRSLGNKEDSSGFRLEGIELDSLNWNKLLIEGRVELGEVKASKGYFSSNDFRIKKNKDSTVIKSQGNILDVIGPILVKRLSITEIEFVGNTFTKRGKETIAINGEHFDIKNLVIDKTLPHKVQLDELQLKVKAFLESDSSRSFQSGFNELSINKNNLILKDYFLHSTIDSTNGKNKIDVKELILVDLSIEDLIDGKLKARELVMNNPAVQLMLPQKNNKKAAFSWRKMQNEISRKIDIGLIRINNSAILINQVGRKAPIINTDSFYAVIASGSLLRSQTIDQLFEGNNSFFMPRLALRMEDMWIDCRNALYERESLSADIATGRSKDGNLRFNFKKLKLTDINTAGIITAEDSTWLRILDIGSGDVYIKLPDKAKKKQASSSKIPSQLIRTIHSGKLQVHLDGKDLSVRTTLDSISIERLRQSGNDWIWDSLLVRGNKLSIVHPAVKGTTGKFQLSSEQQNTIHNSRWEIDNKQLSGIFSYSCIGNESQHKKF